MRIKNWSDFQHFKDRTPPWIKLHRSTLEQRDINMISDCSFRVLIGLWLLASEDRKMEGNLPQIDDIAFRLRVDATKLINSLIELDDFLEHDDNKTISERYQLDVPEESRGETEKSNAQPLAFPNGKEHEACDRFDQFWGLYPRKKDKKKARIAFLRMTKTKQLKAIEDVPQRYSDVPKDRLEYLPYPTTYIHGERWDDEMSQQGDDFSNYDTEKLL